MASKAKVPCRAPGCPVLIPMGSGGRCDAHRKPKEARWSDDGLSADERGYDFRWRKLRAMYLRNHPLCALCEERGEVKAAAMVDHIVPIRKGGARLSEENLQSLCVSCHLIKTAKDNRE